MCHTHKPNIHQPMKSHGMKLLSLWKQLHHTNPLIHLGPPKSKPKLALYFLISPHQHHILSHIKTPAKVTYFESDQTHPMPSSYPTPISF